MFKQVYKPLFGGEAGIRLNGEQLCFHLEVMKATRARSQEESVSGRSFLYKNGFSVKVGEAKPLQGSLGFIDTHERDLYNACIIG